MIELPADGDEKKARRKRSSADRIEHDAYMTPPTLVDAIVKRIIPLTDGIPADGRILEPACGDGEFVAALKAAFPMARIVGVDIREDRRAKIEAMAVKFVGQDFLTLPGAALAAVDLAVTNPPFDLFTEFLEHLLRNLKPGTPVVFLQRMGHLVGSTGAREGTKNVQAWWRTPLDPANPFSYPMRQLQMRLPLHPRPSFTGGGTDSQEYEIGVYVAGSDNRGIFDPIVWEKPQAKRGRKPAAQPQADAAGGDAFAS